MRRYPGRMASLPTAGTARASAIAPVAAEFQGGDGLDCLGPATRMTRACRAYIGWRQDRLFELWDVWDGVIRAEQAPCALIPNSGGGASSIDMLESAKSADISLPTARRATAAASVGERQKWQGNRAALGGNPSAGSSAWASRNAIAGRTRCRRGGVPPLCGGWRRQWAAPLVHQVWRGDL